MVQHPQSSADPATDLGHRVIQFPTRAAARRHTDLPEQSADRSAAGPQTRVRTDALREVVLFEVSGQLRDVVQDLDQAIQLAMVEGRRGVVCDLADVLEDPEPDAIASLATVGRHARDWPGIRVAVACPCPRVRAGLAAHPLGRHLIVTVSMLAALSAVLESPGPAFERLRLEVDPTASRTSPDRITPTLLG